MFFVMCVYEGEYQLATRRSFASYDEAQGYADGVNSEYKAFVVSA